MKELSFEDSVNISGGDAYETGQAVGYYLGFAIGFVSGGAVILATMAMKGAVETATGN